MENRKFYKSEKFFDRKLANRKKNRLDFDLYVDQIRCLKNFEEGEREKFFKANWRMRRTKKIFRFENGFDIRKHHFVSKKVSFPESSGLPRYNELGQIS